MHIYKKHKKEKLVLVISFILLAFTLTSCVVTPRDTTTPPDNNLPDNNMPDNNLPDNNMPDNNMPDNNLPDNGTSGTKTTPSQDANKLMTDSGTYVGQADANSIEVRIGGVQDDKNAYRVFKLSDELKQQFSKLALKENDQIQFNYYEQSGGQPVITDITRLTGKA